MIFLFDPICTLVRHGTTMPFSELSEKVYETAEKDLRHAFEYYTGMDTKDESWRYRNEDEVVDWLAIQYKFSSSVCNSGCIPSLEVMESFTANEFAFFNLASRLNSTILNRIMVYPDFVQERVLSRMEELPNVPVIGPMRTIRRYYKKQKQNIVREEPVISEKKQKQEFDYFVPQTPEEKELEIKRRLRAQEERKNRKQSEKNYTISGPSHREATVVPKIVPIEHTLERQRWREEKPLRKEYNIEQKKREAEEKKAAKERERKKKQKAKKKLQYKSEYDDIENLSKKMSITLGDFIVK